jgi:hypothetical protein
MAARAARVTAATTATRLDITTVTQIGRYGLLVRNRGSVAVYLGGSDVTTATGYQLDPGEAQPVDLAGYDSGLYGIVASGTAVCHVLQVGA